MKYEKNVGGKFMKLYVKDKVHRAQSAMTETRAAGMLKYLFFMQMSLMNMK